jgi:hypothetical protein
MLVADALLTSSLDCKLKALLAFPKIVQPG